MTDWLFFLPEQASSLAPRVDRLIHVFLTVAGIAVILIAGCIIVFALRYRRTRRPAPPERTPTVALVEIVWTLVPLGIFVAFFVWGARIFLDQFAAAPPNAYQVFVLGKQWMWKFEHPNGRREINEVHLPVGRPVQFIMISQDVIHGAFIPAFRLKHDVLPSEYAFLSFEPSREGSFHLFCTQYCGTEHSRMTGRVVLLSQPAFDDWLNATPGQGAPASLGKALLEKLQCRSCHRIGASATAPPLEGLFGRRVALADGSSVLAGETYIRESILDPKRKIAGNYQDVMPSYRGQVSEEDIMHIIAYLKSTRVEP